MKSPAIVSILFPVLFAASSAFGWSGQWNNLYPFGGYQCAPIPLGSLIQLIHAGNNWQQDDPMDWCMSQPNPQQAVKDWLAAGCPPVGDDTLKDETVFLDYGTGYEGYFGKFISGPNSDDPWGHYEPWYTRFFTAPKNGIGVTNWYGEVGDPDDPDDPIYMVAIPPKHEEPPYDFLDYKIKLEGVCADRQIIPEPSTLLIGVVAMLIGLVRGRKQGSSV